MNFVKSKKLLSFIVLTQVIVWIAGCGSSTTQEKPSASPSSAPFTANTANNADDTGISNDAWDNYMKAARKEGVVTVAGSNSPDFRQKATEIMKEKYGITLEYLTLNNSEAIARIEREAAAKQTTIDVVVSGTTEIVKIPNLLERLDDKIVMPEVKDTSKWKNNELAWIDLKDKKEKTSLQLTRYVYLTLWVNTKMIDPKTIKWADLLDPKYKGKIVSFDPRGSGQGQLAAMFLLNTFKEDYINKLYVDQKVTYSNDGKQIAGWLANGTYPIAIGLLARDVSTFLKEGLPIAPVSPPDAPGFTNGKIVKIIKQSPHPNAAVVFTNWLASKEGQQLFAKSFDDVSLRNDVDLAGIPEFLIPKQGVDYPDYATEEFYVNVQPKAQKLLIDLLGR